MGDAEKSSILSKLGEGALLAAATAVAYLAAFQYQSGYLGYFGVPVELVSVDLAVFLRFGSFVALLICIIAGQTWSLFDESDSRWISEIITFYASVGAVAFGVEKLAFSLGFWYWTIFAVLGIAAVCEVTLAMRRKHGEEALYLGFARRVMKSAQRFFDPGKPKAFAKYTVAFFVLAGFCVAVTSFVGYGTASQKTTFSVLARAPSWVLVGTFGDSLILAEADGSNLEFRGKIKLLKADTEEKFELRKFAATHSSSSANRTLTGPVSIATATPLPTATPSPTATPLPATPPSPTPTVAPTP